MRPPRFDAVVFDLLTALLDSWTLWNRAAESDAEGRRWRQTYLRLTYDCGAYRPYEELVREAAEATGLAPRCADVLVANWQGLQPWREVREVLGEITRRGVRLAVATNCSVDLGSQAARIVGVPFSVIVTAEAAGHYKPRPEPYRAVLTQLGTVPARTLFVAGSPADIPGATGVGMPVFWHNRAHLPFLVTRARPFLMADTLHPLLDLT